MSFVKPRVFLLAYLKTSFRTSQTLLRPVAIQWCSGGGGGGGGGVGWPPLLIFHVDLGGSYNF